MIFCIVLYITIIPIFRRVTQVQLQLQCTIPGLWVCSLVMFIFLSSKDKPCDTVGRELKIFRFTVCYTNHSASHPITNKFTDKLNGS